MRGLAYEPNLQPITPVASNRKSHRIVSTFLGKSLAARGVAEIAKVVHFLAGWFRTFVARCAAMAIPSAAQRQPRRMQPTAIL
jgi:hypothetical protein